MDYKFDSIGLMLDCSRNKVTNIKTLKKIIDIMSIMGYDSLQLYTEDTYEVEGQPYFGYMRGRYTADEIRELDCYAKGKNIKLIPCIQTLAHLNAVFKWPAYSDVHDINDILLAGEEKTYELIDHMLCSLRKAYSSDIIHLGMDEAFMVGKGAYYSRYGDSVRYDLLLSHLRKVVSIAKKYNFKPVIWSDMFAKEAKRNDNFDFEKAKKEISGLADLVYWTYYTDDLNVYRSEMDFQHKLCDNLWFAGGLWSWGGFAPVNRYSVKNNTAAVKACMEKGIKNIFFTMWGDNGGECSFFSLLPAMYHASCHAHGITDEEEIKKKFRELLGLEYDDFMLLDELNILSGRFTRENPSKYMLYNDVFLGLHDTSVNGSESGFYAGLYKRICDAAKRAGDYRYIFDCLGNLCHVLEVKYDLGLRTRKAYREGNIKELKKLSAVYDIAVKRMKKFYKSFRILWEKENKPFGFEIQDIRLGGLMTRLKNCRRRLNLYLRHKTGSIPELEETVLDYYNEGNNPTWHNNWGETVTPGII